MSVTMIFISAILVNNIVLSQFLGICPFLGVSKKISTAVGMGLAVMFVMTISSVATYLIYYRRCHPLHTKGLFAVAFGLLRPGQRRRLYPRHCTDGRFEGTHQPKPGRLAAIRARRADRPHHRRPSLNGFHGLFGNRQLNNIPDETRSVCYHFS